MGAPIGFETRQMVAESDVDDRYQDYQKDELFEALRRLAKCTGCTLFHEVFLEDRKVLRVQRDGAGDVEVDWLTQAEAEPILKVVKEDLELGDTSKHFGDSVFGEPADIYLPHLDAEPEGDLDDLFGRHAAVVSLERLRNHLQEIEDYESDFDLSDEEKEDAAMRRADVRVCLEWSIPYVIHWS